MKACFDRWLVIGLVSFALLGLSEATVHAEEEAGQEEVVEKKKKKKAPKEKKPKVPPVEKILIGMLTKTEKAAKKEGQKPKITYTLTQEDGSKLVVPAPKPPRKKKKKGKDDAPPPPVINLDDYVDAKVNMTAMAIDLKKKDKVLTRIIKVVSIEKVEEEGAAPAADAPATDEAAE